MLEMNQALRIASQLQFNLKIESYVNIGNLTKMA